MAEVKSLNGGRLIINNIQVAYVPNSVKYTVAKQFETVTEVNGNQKSRRKTYNVESADKLEFALLNTSDNAGIIRTLTDEENTVSFIRDNSQVVTMLDATFSGDRDTGLDSDSQTTIMLEGTITESQVGI